MAQKKQRKRGKVVICEEGAQKEKEKRVPFVEKDVGLWPIGLGVMFCRPKIVAGGRFLRPWLYKNG